MVILFRCPLRGEAAQRALRRQAVPYHSTEVESAALTTGKTYYIMKL